MVLQARQSVMQSVRASTLVLSVGIVLMACGPADHGPDTGNAAVQLARLPIRTTEVMASLINHYADPLWSAIWQNPQTNEDWRELELQARQLQLGGALLLVPGSGPLDGEWTSDSDWSGFANQLQVSAGRALSAVQERDLEGITRAGADIVQVCNGCHSAFVPALPTINLLMPPYMPQGAR